MKSTVRPRLEALESRDVPSFLAAEFPGQGVWRYDSSNGSWQQMTAANASLVAADSAGNVVAQIPGQGVWLYSYGTWQQITANNAVALDLANYSVSTWGQPYDTVIVAAAFPGQGLWRYTSNRQGSSPPTVTWTELTAADAAVVAVDGNAAVAAEFRGHGVWHFADRSGWQQLAAADASSLAIGATLNLTSWVVATFPGQGVWRIQVEVQGWQLLTASDAATVGINQNGDVVGEFPGWGVWSYSDAGAGGYNPGWIHLTAADAVMVGIDAAGNVYGQFPGWGVWYDRFGYWQYITPSNASSCGIGG
jgi:hypothetical protein